MQRPGNLCCHLHKTRMKRQLLFLCSIIFLCLVISCKKTTEVDPPFEENIKIRMTETVDSVKRVLNLICVTEKIFPCSNWGIETVHSVTDDKITIQFIRISYPNICATSLGPASAIINLDGLANKTYELELNFGTSKIDGQLNVTPGSFNVVIPAQTKVQFINTDLKRIPDNTIYGTIGYHSTSTSSLVQKFIDTLLLYGAIPTLYTPGDYGEFEIEANGQIKQTQDPGYYFTRRYIFSYSNNSGVFRDLVKRFGRNYPNLLSITLKTTKGETFYSWIQ